MGLFLDKPQKNFPFLEIYQKLTKPENIYEFSVEQFCDNGEGELNRYSVYRITANQKHYVLKKSDEQEINIYKNFLNSKAFHTPAFYGNIEMEGNHWILLEYIEGPDLRDFSVDMAYACAESITTIMNSYWQSDEIEFQQKKCDHRFERYLKRIEKRALCLLNEEKLSKAYQLFIDRQKLCPRTLCNGDFLQYNAIYRNKCVYIIDWAFAGIMPYSLDIARLIAHGTEKRTTFPFYMTNEHRQIYIKEVYKRLSNKPDWKQYLRDIRLSLLNEYVEFIEYELNHPQEERDAIFDYHYNQANDLSDEILLEYRKL